MTDIKKDLNIDLDQIYKSLEDSMKLIDLYRKQLNYILAKPKAEQTFEAKRIPINRITRTIPKVTTTEPIETFNGQVLSFQTTGWNCCNKIINFTQNNVRELEIKAQDNGNNRYTFRVAPKNSRAISLLEFSFEANKSLTGVKLGCGSPRINNFAVYYKSNPTVPYSLNIFATIYDVITVLEDELLRTGGSYGKALPKILKRLEGFKLA